jgi:hypothetical protein
MTTQKQIAANRANAGRSTGPSRSEGKARSRMNAWKHGMTAEKVVIAGEDAEVLRAIQRELFDEYQPSPGVESLLVFEAALLREGPMFPGRLGYTDGGALSTLLRYEMSLSNASYRTLQQLVFLQARRRQNGSSALEARPVEVRGSLNPPAAG